MTDLLGPLATCTPSEVCGCWCLDPVRHTLRHLDDPLDWGLPCSAWRLKLAASPSLGPRRCRACDRDRRASVPKGMAPGANAKVGLVPEEFLVVKAACFQQHSRSPGCQAMKSIALALLVGCSVFVPPYTVHALDTQSLLPPVKLVPQPLSTGPVPQVSPGDEKQPTPQPRQESPTDGMPTGPQSPEADHASSPPTGASSEQAPPAAPVPAQSGTGFPWWPVICAVLVVMLVYQMKRRA